MLYFSDTDSETVYRLFGNVILHEIVRSLSIGDRTRQNNSLNDLELIKVIGNGTIQ